MGAEESQCAEGVDIGQDMVSFFSEHIGSEAEKRRIILHHKNRQRATVRLQTGKLSDGLLGAACGARPCLLGDNLTPQRRQDGPQRES
jgi:hypothetical protein